MRLATMAIAIFGMLLTSSASVSAQNAGRCQSYWFERNAMLKEYRYCFRSPRAIYYFGNGGCVYERVNDIPFNRSDRERLLEIRAMERVHQCSPRLTRSASSKKATLLKD